MKKYTYDDAYFNSARIERNPSKYKIYPGKLQICAPISDINMDGMEVKDYRVVQKQVPDPVVLQSVKGRYLILTTWGDESDDPIVINEINQ